MNRIDKIIEHDLYKQHIAKIEMAEANRCFCRHNMGHFLDVARIAMILNLEEGLGIDKDLIYAAALTHDIGRHKQYEDGTPHEIASAEYAPSILADAGFFAEEITVIVEAIRLHRSAEIANEKSLNGIIYRADKLSRACFACKAEKDCDWKKDKKNLVVKW